MVLKSSIISRSHATLRSLHIRAVISLTAESLHENLLPVLSSEACQLREIVFYEVAMAHQTATLFRNCQLPNLRRLLIIRSRVLIALLSIGGMLYSNILNSKYASNLTHLAIDVHGMRSCFIRAMRDSPDLPRLQYFCVSREAAPPIESLRASYSTVEDAAAHANVFIERFGFPSSVLSLPRDFRHLASSPALDTQLSNPEFISVPYEPASVPTDVAQAAELQPHQKLELIRSWKEVKTSAPIPLEDLLFVGSQSALLVHLIAPKLLPDVLATMLHATKKLQISWDAQDSKGDTILHKNISPSLRQKILVYLAGNDKDCLRRLVNARNKKGKKSWSVIHWGRDSILLATPFISFDVVRHKMELKSFLSSMARDDLHALLTKRAPCFTIDILTDTSIIQQLCALETDRRASIVVPLVIFARELCKDDTTLKEETAAVFFKCFDFLVPDFLRRWSRSAVHAFSALTTNFRDVPDISLRLEVTYPAIYREIFHAARH